jgi:ribose transport system ATP-binding protein
MAPSAPRLEARDLRKAYNVPVLTGFDFALAPGEVHALVGSNGAGKSTFARIVCGMTPADGGELLLDGRPFAPASKRAATAAGVVMVLQELSIIPTLNVAENISFGRLPQRFGLIDRVELRRRATAALSLVGLGKLDPEVAAGRLGLGQRQLVEIAAALAQECRLLILDEPTAALTATEADELFARVRDLRAKGVGILYVSHRMDEIRRIADRVTVLRDGRHIATHAAARIELPVLVGQMAGRAMAESVGQRRALGTGGLALDVRGIRAGPAVQGVDLAVRAGEVVGIAGLVGSGRTELLRAIFGADPKDAGEVLVRGTAVAIRRPADAVAAGIGMVPEDRKGQGLLLAQSIRMNVTLATHDLFSRHGWLDDDREREATRERCAELEMKYADLERPVAELSGGNQQKAVMARWVLRDAAVLLCDEPTRGIDVAAKRTIYRLLRGLAEAGKAIVMVSSELPELMENCDRIVVMSAGRLTAEFTPDEWSEERITAAAFRGYLHANPPAGS